MHIPNKSKKSCAVHWHCRTVGVSHYHQCGVSLLCLLISVSGTFSSFLSIVHLPLFLLFQQRSCFWRKWNQIEVFIQIIIDRVYLLKCCLEPMFSTKSCQILGLMKMIFVNLETNITIKCQIIRTDDDNYVCPTLWRNWKIYQVYVFISVRHVLISCWF